MASTKLPPGTKVEVPKAPTILTMPSDLTEEQLIERLAKAACVAYGDNPNEEMLLSSVDGPVKRWSLYSGQAKEFLAMFKALQDG